MVKTHRAGDKAGACCQSTIHNSANGSVGSFIIIQEMTGGKAHGSSKHGNHVNGGHGHAGGHGHTGGHGHIKGHGIGDTSPQNSITSITNRKGRPSRMTQKIEDRRLAESPPDKHSNFVQSLRGLNSGFHQFHAYTNKYRHSYTYF